MILMVLMWFSKKKIRIKMKASGRENAFFLTRFHFNACGFIGKE